MVVVFMRSLGSNLRLWRRAKGYTQDEMATIFGVHRTTYTKYETGVTDPPLDTLCRMADFFGCTVDSLLGRK